MSIQLNVDVKVSNLENVSDNTFSDKAVDLFKSGLKSDLNLFGEVAKRDVATESEVDLGNPSDRVLSSEVIPSGSFSTTLVGQGSLYTRWHNYSAVDWSQENPILPASWTEDSIMQGSSTFTSDTITIPVGGKWFLMRFFHTSWNSGNPPALPSTSAGYHLVDGNLLRSAVKYVNYSRESYYPTESNAFWITLGRAYFGLCQESDRKLRVCMPNWLGSYFNSNFNRGSTSQLSTGVFHRIHVKVYKL